MMEQIKSFKVLAWGMAILIPVTIAIVFLITTDYSRPNTWINVFFFVIAFALAVIVCLAPIKKDLAVLNWTVYVISAFFIMLELFVSVVFLYVISDYPHWAFAVHLLLVVGFVVLNGLLYLYNNYTTSQMSLLQQDVNKVKQWKLKVELLQSANPTTEQKQLIELLNVSPVTSNDNVVELENEISLLVENLPNNIDLVHKKIVERNIMLKAYH